ncbi:plasmid mobilization protein [Streptomyces sp. NPDC002067]
MHRPHHEALITPGAETATPAPGGASYSAGPSKGWSSALASTPGAEEDPRQGARDQQLVAEGSHKWKAKQGRRRSRQPQQRGVRLTFRASAVEAAEIQQAADAKGISKARFIAQAVDAALHDRPGTDRDETLDRLEAARIQLVRAGTNLNQIAKILNSGGDAHHVSRATDAVAEAAAEVRSATRKLVS